MSSPVFGTFVFSNDSPRMTGYTIQYNRKTLSVPLIIHSGLHNLLHQPYFFSYKLVVEINVAVNSIGGFGAAVI